MKIILGLALLLIASTGYSQSFKKVLFIGNSYTSANNLPDLVKSLAQADGNGILTDAFIPGGSQLHEHAINPTVLNKITAEDWDYVILQEQSQIPSFPLNQVESLFYPAAEILSDSIYSNNECSIPLFYATWGRQNGDNQWDSINTFEKMNKRLYDSYDYMANEVGGMLSPVGIGFAHIKQDASAAVNFNDLYTGDGSHPTIKGSYLAACIFNNVIYEGTSIGNTFLPAGLTALEAEYLQEVADHVVYEVDSVHVGFRPSLGNNDFTTAINAGSVSFTPTITVGNFDSWDFGDGQISTEEDAVHTYTSNGTYEVTMYSSTLCESDSVKQTVVISTLGFSDEELEVFNVYPNPSLNGTFYIDLVGEESYSVYTLMGKEVYNGNEKQLSLSKGVYLVKHKSQSRRIIVL